jgi:REP element-mobilizing transposase RayT
MPRILRIQYAGARYHVINRGNYRANVFSSKGAIGALRDVDVPVIWIAEKLRMGKSALVRSILSRQRNAKTPQ